MGLGGDTSWALDDRKEILSGAGLLSSTCHNPESDTKLGKRNRLEGQQRKGGCFPKTTFHAFPVISNHFESSPS